MKAALKIMVFSAGVFIPFILVVILMYATGTFDKFWFWTVEYAGKYAAGIPWSEGKERLAANFSPFWDEFLWVFILAIAGLIIVLFTKFTLKQKLFTITLLFFSALATTPGFYFRQHYFIVVLPAVALLAALTLDFVKRFITERFKLNTLGIVIPLLVFVLIFYNTVSARKFYYDTNNPKALCKAIYGTNPFTESIEIANYIKANSSDTDKIAVLGSEPQIPFYAQRKSASGHIYTYGLMEIQDYNLKMQEEMISEIEKNKPLYLVFCNIPYSWLGKPNSPQRIFDWYYKYSKENYNVVGLVDIPDQGTSSFYWDANAMRPPLNKNYIWVYRRK